MRVVAFLTLALVVLSGRSDVVGQEGHGRANNEIVLFSDQADGTYLNIQNIHTTIRPQESFVRVDGEWQGREADWEGESYQVQTTYLAAWSIEVHYDDDAIERLGFWKYSESSGQRYAVLTGKHVPKGLSMPVAFATRDEAACMLSRKFDPGPEPGDYPESYWHARDWDFVEQRMSEILESKGLARPWSDYSREQLVAALGNWIKDARLTGDSVEENLHPVDFLESGSGYCGGAANALVAMCSILKIPARYFGTWDHAFVEFQDDGGRWRFVENQTDTFMHLKSDPANPYDPEKQLDEARDWAREQNFNAVFDGGIIDLMARPERFGVADLPKLGWFYNWSCPKVYDGRGGTREADICVRPQTLHDWVFNLYTGYGGYEGDSVHKRGFFMGERLNSVFELSALYSPRRADLPYVFAKAEAGGTHIMFLTPFRDSYYAEWDNKTKVPAGSGNGVRKRFYLSDLDGVRKVVAAIILGPDGTVDAQVPEAGGDWTYVINGQSFPVSAAGGFLFDENYRGTGMTVHRFEIPLSALRSAAN